MSATRRLNVLLSCYSCGPGRGSEPGVGWNVALALAKLHDVHVLTTSEFTEPIEALVAEGNLPKSLHFHFFELPLGRWWWKHGRGRGIQVHYYLWQLAALPMARRLHASFKFDIAQHVTLAKYWAPSFLAWLGVPYVWGPVGGGESAPKAFWRDFGLRGIWKERVRETLRWIADHDPLVRVVAHRCAVALASTDETRARIRSLGLVQCHVISQVALSHEEYEALGIPNMQGDTAPIRFVSLGNLLHLKGFHLGLRAFAAAAISGAEYWIVGDGPERDALEKLTAELGIGERVKFLGWKPRAEALELLRQCSVLIHPSLHDSASFVCVEAMAAGKPVLCLRLGGPPLLVASDCGRVIDASNPSQVVSDLASAIRRMAQMSESEMARMSRCARSQVAWHDLWTTKVRIYSTYYEQLLKKSEHPGHGPD